MKRAAVLCALALMLLCGCGRGQPEQAQATPTPTPTTAATPAARTSAEDAALDEALEQDADDPTEVTTEDRAAARGAAAQYAAELLPTWKVLGIHSHFVGRKAYRVMVDIEKGKRRETLDLMAVRFFPNEGEPYWKIRPLTINLDHALRETEEVDRLRELNRLKFELEEAEK